MTSPGFRATWSPEVGARLVFTSPLVVTAGPLHSQLHVTTSPLSEAKTQIPCSVLFVDTEVKKQCIDKTFWRFKCSELWVED